MRRPVLDLAACDVGKWRHGDHQCFHLLNLFRRNLLVLEETYHYCKLRNAVVVFSCSIHFLTENPSDPWKVLASVPQSVFQTSHRAGFEPVPFCYLLKMWV